MLAGLLLTLSVSAQDPNATEMKLTTPDGKPKTVISQSKNKLPLEEQKRLEFEGFVVGLLSSNKLIKVFDLTAPVEPKKEKERVVVDQSDGHTIGFRLLSIRF